MTQGAYLTQTVLKALDVLECLASTDQPLTVPKLARLCGLSRPTAYRLLTTLQSRGYVMHTRDGHYDLGTNVLSLSKSLLEHLDLPEVAKPALQQLSQASDETTHLGLLDGARILYIGKVESSQTLRLHSAIGTRNSLYSTAMGKAILAFLAPEERAGLLDQITLVAYTPNTITDRSVLAGRLAEIRARGWAIDDTENEEGIRCIGAPIFNHEGRPVAALSISGPAYRLSISRLVEFSQLVLKAAGDVSFQLGYLPPCSDEERGNRS
jgi:IclR family acetate operon transcriptional repressor